MSHFKKSKPSCHVALGEREGKRIPLRRGPDEDGETERRTRRTDGAAVHNRRAQGGGLINTKHFKGNPTLPHSESAGARDKRLIKHTRRRGCSAAQLLAAQINAASGSPGPRCSPTLRSAPLCSVAQRAVVPHRGASRSRRRR